MSRSAMPPTLQFLAAAVLVVLTLRDMRRFARAEAPAGVSQLAAVLSLFAYFAIAGALLLGGVGLWRSLVTNGIESSWIASEAAVVDCRLIHRDSPPGVNDYNYYGAACRFRPTDAREAEIDWEGCCTTESAVRDWLAQHPVGSRLRLYRAPGGQRVSLGWAVGPIDYHSPHRSARETLSFALVGWLLWFLARRLDGAAARD